MTGGPAEPLGLQLLALAGKLTRAEVAITEQDQRLGVLGESVAQYGAAAEQFDEHTMELTDLVVKLAERIGQLEKKAAAAPPPEVLWDWTSMDRVKAEKAWTQLRGWVEAVLIPWYDRLGDDQALPKVHGGGDRRPRLRVPPCWAWHRDVVVELSWLCQDWTSLYRQQQGSPAKAGDWHSRYLPGALHRIRQTSTAALCEVKHSMMPGAADAPAERVELDGSVDRAIQLDLAARPEPAENKP